MLPLFPLPLVVFPSCCLPLQIFEARYLDLVKHCMKDDSEFGVVTQRKTRPDDNNGDQSQAILPVGTRVKITDFHAQANGLLGIQCTAGERFSVCTAHTASNGLVMADVTAIDAEPIEALDSNMHELVAVLESLTSHAFARSLGYAEHFDARPYLANASYLSFHLSYLLPFSIRKKYHLLDCNTAIERLVLIQQWLDQIRDEVTQNE
jgi:hypothetical protein